MVGAVKSFSKKLLGQENHSCIVFQATKIFVKNLKNHLLFILHKVF